MHYCPNCSAELDCGMVSSCWNCHATFGSGSTWSPTVTPTGRFRNFQRSRPAQESSAEDQQRELNSSANHPITEHYSGGAAAIALALACLLALGIQAIFLLMGIADCWGGCRSMGPAIALLITSAVTLVIVFKAANLARRASPLAGGTAFLLLIPSTFVSGLALLVTSLGLLMAIVRAVNNAL